MTRATTVRRIVVFTAVFALLGAALGSGVAAAHTPSCHQTAGADGPHYQGDTSADAAFENNPTLGGDGNPALGSDGDTQWVGSCTVGNSQSPHADN